MVCGVPSVILFPASFVPAHLYYNLRDAVIDRGYEMQVPDLPSVRLGPNDNREPPSMYDDAAFVVEQVEKLADIGRDVIIISHSYSGIPVTQATLGLSKSQRRKEGKRGGLVKIAFVSSLVPALGQAAGTMLTDAPPENQVPVIPDPLAPGWLRHENLTRVAEVVFNDMPLEKGLEWAKKVSEHSAKSFEGQATRLGWDDPNIALSYLVCLIDRQIPPNAQYAQIGMMEHDTGKNVSVSTIPGGHAPMLGLQDLVADWIIKEITAK